MSNFKSTIVSNFMSTEVISVHPTDTCEKVRELFSKNSIHHVIVADENNKLLGILSYNDLALILNWAGRFDLPRAQEEDQKLLSSLTAIDVCTKEVFTITENDTAAICYDIFKSNIFKALPVIDNEGSVKGIVTTYDMLKLAFA